MAMTSPTNDDAPKPLSVPTEYENERLRQHIAELNDALVQSKIMIDFQGQVIMTMRESIENHTHEGDENTLVVSE